jgi:hypothetical protein
VVALEPPDGEMALRNAPEMVHEDDVEMPRMFEHGPGKWFSASSEAQTKTCNFDYDRK